jgi:hypothetical protein
MYNSLSNRNKRVVHESLCIYVCISHTNTNAKLMIEYVITVFLLTGQNRSSHNLYDLYTYFCSYKDISLTFCISFKEQFIKV